MSSKRIAVALVAVTTLSVALVGGCKGGASADCAYKSKDGFCFTPPAGQTPTESTDKVIFAPTVKNPKLFAAQDIVIETTHSALDANALKNEKSYAKVGASKVIEEVDLAGGKGFYILKQAGNGLRATSAVPSTKGDTFFKCSYQVYEQDKEALKEGLQACKSLKAQ